MASVGPVLPSGARLQWGPPGMGGVRREESSPQSRAAATLQWGPPGMGGVSAFARPFGCGRTSIALQWGPPGMGGVSVPGSPKMPNSHLHFNGDLPEWEV